MEYSRWPRVLLNLDMNYSLETKGFDSLRGSTEGINIRSWNNALGRGNGKSQKRDMGHDVVLGRLIILARGLAILFCTSMTTAIREE